MMASSPTPTILLTGANGVIGTLAQGALGARGWSVRPYDLTYPAGTPGHGDIRDRAALDDALAGCAGVIHLAAISRVLWGENDPANCLDVNVGGTRTVLDAVEASPNRPWVLFMSSREVYGNPARLPVREDDPFAPVNTYGRSKAQGERLVMEARARGTQVGILRLASVYGTALDFADRVAPAFARRAVAGEPLRVTGAGQVFDFVHLHDVVDGICRTADLLFQGRSDLPAINLSTAVPTSLGALAAIACRLAGSGAAIVEEGARPFDPEGFVGDYRRAREILAWSPQITIERGMAQLVADFTALAQGAASAAIEPQGRRGAGS